MIEIISPHTEQVVGSVPAASQVDAAVAVASQALAADRWGNLSIAERLAVVRRFADAYADLADDFAEIEAEPVSIASLAALDIPILFGRGESDPVADPAAYERLVSLIPGGTLAALPGAGHSPCLPNARATMTGYPIAQTKLTGSCHGGGLCTN
jgi:acyl-CoA reductase-like NAD-dependent aldehyde dehydrogenase